MTRNSWPALLTPLGILLAAVMASLGGAAPPATPTTKPAATTSPASAAPAAKTPAAKPSDAKALPAELDTYVKPDGSGYFAFILPAQSGLPRAAGHDIVILFDTSASQIGDARERGFKALETLIGACQPSDRICLLAVDLAPVPMTADFVAPESSELTAGLDKLNRRVPLGATDLPLALEKSLARFSSGSKNARAIVYIGDGLSTAQLLVPAMFVKLSGLMVEQQTPFFCYGVGPRVDGQMLAALANYTGGTIALDDPSIDAKAAGLFLADSARGPVIWIDAVEWPQEFDEVYPRKLPPLRADRETVVVGKGNPSGAVEISAEGQVDGEKISRRWSATAKPPTDDNAYLPLLVAMAEKDDGTTLPTLGAKGLAQVGRMLTAGGEELVKLAQQMLAAESFDGADQLVNEALKRDPQDPAALALKKEIAKRRAEAQAKVKQQPKKSSDAKPADPKAKSGKSGSAKTPAKKTPPDAK